MIRLSIPKITGHPWLPSQGGLLPAILMATGIAIVGVYLLQDSRAASDRTGIEAESGARSGNAAPFTSKGASGGTAVKFGAAPTSSPTPTPSPTSPTPTPTPTPSPTSPSPSPTPAPAPSPTPSPSPPPPAPGPVPKPNASNTGYPVGQAFTTYSGSDTNTVSNVTYNGVNFPAVSGGYLFKGSNVTFKNCKIGTGIIVEGDNIRIERCEVAGDISINNSDTVVITHNNIHSWGDGLHVTTETKTVRNVSFTNNYVHSPAPGCGAHSDGVQLIGIDGFTATYNNIDMGKQFNLCGDPNPLNGAFQIKTDFNGVLNRNLTISNNWLNGGGYTLRIYQCGSSRVTNNRFGRDYSFGPVDVTATNCFIDKSGNVFDDNNAPINF